MSTFEGAPRPRILGLDLAVQRPDIALPRRPGRPIHDREIAVGTDPMAEGHMDVGGSPAGGLVGEDRRIG